MVLLVRTGAFVCPPTSHQFRCLCSAYLNLSPVFLTACGIPCLLWYAAISCSFASFERCRSSMALMTSVVRESYVFEIKHQLTEHGLGSMAKGAMCMSPVIAKKPPPTYTWTT